ncbi:hypothetical protein B7P34_12220 [Streptosporangium nondiastaticum]|uniref:Uncharacterized protein n=1 Tax=Streptosporangium nondiastaticum TaxID=35764 RepID=A0A9X7PHX8_9ACTN|nr:hypothetical protein B7P34_12220 [Streptosporangium nondiastaticum]
MDLLRAPVRRQLPLSFLSFVHYGVLPRAAGMAGVGGVTTRGGEAHDVIVSVFGDMSKRECSRLMG